MHGEHGFLQSAPGNWIAERFVRTLKENLLWIRRFDTVEELRLALLELKDTYTRNGSVGDMATRLRLKCEPPEKRP